ncbi:MAG: hypothetical protein WDM96_02680 [Lacunisphaera sp.]
MIFVLGLFNLLQATALAFGRVGDSNDFVSRYGDLLFLGTIAGAFALGRLDPGTGLGRRLFLAATVLWSALAVVGLVRNSTGGHANYFHTYAAENAALRRTAIQTYLADGNRTVLEAPGTRGGAVLRHGAHREPARPAEIPRAAAGRRKPGVPA